MRSRTVFVVVHPVVQVAQGGNEAHRDERY